VRTVGYGEAVRSWEIEDCHRKFSGPVRTRGPDRAPCEKAANVMNANKNYRKFKPWPVERNVRNDGARPPANQAVLTGQIKR